MPVPIDFTEIAHIIKDVYSNTGLEFQVGQYDPSDESENHWGDTTHPFISFRSIQRPSYNTVKRTYLRYSGVTQLIPFLNL